ncbi:alpha/beta fold hydrolase [Micromonospora endophytica]|uniref:alpha/beta fold hydrolase n=1 Tax=Micromonospora endophytica TaxID=515350 RepID=UPI0015E8DF8B|nr:alpha/beta hydrolase [Micromonospora endophytica]BCJ62117.1 hypothetical protein Jiend_55390 [Micromonospora endophytica]
MKRNENGSSGAYSSRPSACNGSRWLIVAGQRPITLSANATPTAGAAWRALPSWAVVGTDDLVIPASTQRSMAERAGSKIFEVAASHVSMVSHPEATVSAILAAAEHVGG